MYIAFPVRIITTGLAYVMKHMYLFLSLFMMVRAFSQCLPCTHVNPATLPAMIPGVKVCVDENKIYNGTPSTSLEGGAIEVCSGVHLMFNGSLKIEHQLSYVALYDCSTMHVNGAIINDVNPSGVRVMSSSCCEGSVTATGQWSGYELVCDMPLPVQLGSFDLYVEADHIRVSWTTYSEINNSHFILERSSDLTNWDLIEQVPGAGNSNELLVYGITDHEPVHGTSYYRLSQVDYDGTTEIFPEEPVMFVSGNDRPIVAYPNPAHGILVIQASGLEYVSVPWMILNSEGRTILSGQAATSTGRVYEQLDITGLQAGQYLVRFHDRAVRFIVR